MNSPTHDDDHPMNNLAAQLEQIGLRALPPTWTTFWRAPRSARWSPRMMLEQLAQAEAEDRSRRSWNGACASPESRSFKPMADYEWTWPTKIERDIIERALTLDFLHEARNLVLVGRNGLGKTMIAQEYLPRRRARRPLRVLPFRTCAAGRTPPPDPGRTAPQASHLRQRRPLMRR